MRSQSLCCTALIVLALGLFSIQGPAVPAAAEEEKSFLSVPLSLSYASTYWWRGVELNGKGVGVLWPSAGVNFGNTGLSILAAAGLNADYFTAEKQPKTPMATSGTAADYLAYVSRDRRLGFKNSQTYHEFDYGMYFSRDIGEMATIGLGAMYAHYPFYDRADHRLKDPSYIEGSFFMALKTMLSPRIDFYYDYYVKNRRVALYDGSSYPDGKPVSMLVSAHTPKNEDYFIKFSLAQDLVATDQGFKFTISPWIGYYNNKYLDRVGFSDAGVKAGISKAYKKASFTAGLYFARSLSSDFYSFDTDGNLVKDAKLRNHFWADFGAGYTF